MPLYKEQGIVIRTMKLGEADRIVTIMTQGSGKVRAVAKGIRKTTSRFGARLEPLTQVAVLVYRGRGALDTVSQADIVATFRPVREDLSSLAAAQAMAEIVDRVAEEHERNPRLYALFVAGLSALEARDGDPELVAQSFLLKVLSLVGYHPSLEGCAQCGSRDVERFASTQGGAVCGRCAGVDAEPVSSGVLGFLAALARADLTDAGRFTAGGDLRREARALLGGFTEYHLERRMKTLPLLARSVAR